MNSISKWLIEQNSYFGTNGFGIYPDSTGEFITEEACNGTGLKLVKFEIGYCDSKVFYDQLRSENLLLVSPNNLIDIEVIRPWRRFQFVGDLFPFGNMFPSEIYGEEESDWEWSWKLHTKQIKYQGILDLDDPSKHQFWYAFSSDQKRTLARIHQYIKSTNVKALPRGIRIYNEP